MKSYLIIILTFFLSPSFIFACSCINAGDFCTILPNAIEQGLPVVQGSPVRTIGHGMEFEITEVVSGTENRKRIIVWGAPGYLCRNYVTGFQRRDQLFMILDPISRERTEMTTGETEREGDYSLSVCGQFFVYLNGPNKTDIECFTPSKSKPSLIKVSPNPANGFFSLMATTELEIEDIIQVNVFQANGQLLYQRGQLAIQKNDDSIEIETATWVNGLYFVEIRSLQNRWLAKVLVMN